MPRYNPATIEPKWQAYWDEHKTFRAPEMPGTPARAGCRMRYRRHSRR
ncbi:hypothetical protein Pla175_41840 [Pirellulimonas nuda]|uniref:Leucine--tRNA ligase n=1 Tax=Pirellulimonas nuda TaxID=2528009 RepID=A0A518DH17_9BACT|nr:hypothetical protein Pla175_41840 [Pirellulimonas nuda]